MRAAVVLASGWPGGQTTSTVQPALAKAIASRAVGYQRNVVTTKTLGFTVRQPSRLEETKGNASEVD